MKDLLVKHNPDVILQECKVSEVVLGLLLYILTNVRAKEGIPRGQPIHI